MSKEIINKVAQSALEVFDLEDYYPEGKRVQIDIRQWLEDGLILKEKDFRMALSTHDWSQYKDQYVAVFSSPDLIVPAWATILVSSYLIPYAKKIISGTIEDMEHLLYQEILTKLDVNQFANKPVILKGCSRKPVPKGAYILAMQLLQPVARSIMYGEACSAVPLYKKSKS